MFAIETLIIIAVGLVFAAFCFYVARLFAQESIYDNFAAYISADRLWVVAGVVVLTFGIAALIPSVVFSKIPVSQVFRRFVEKNTDGNTLCFSWNLPECRSWAACWPWS